MLGLTLISFCVLVAAWLVVRLWRAREPMRRLADARLDEDGLRASAEAVLAARLARGEIDDATYARTRQALWGLPLALGGEASAAEATTEPEQPGVASAEEPQPDAPPTELEEPGVASADQQSPNAEARADDDVPFRVYQGELALGDPPPEPYL